MILYLLALRVAISIATACERPSFWCAFPNAIYSNQDCDGDNIADHSCVFNNEPFLFIGSRSGNCNIESMTGRPTFPAPCVDVVDCSTQDCTVPCESNVQCNDGERAIPNARCNTVDLTCVDADHDTCCEQLDECTNAGCDLNTQYIKEQFCATGTCRNSDQAHCCGMRASCQAVNFFSRVCDLDNEVIKGGEFCERNACTDLDHTVCCAPRATCDTRAQCDTNEYVDTTKKCQGETCTSSDHDTCCKPKAMCDFNVQCDFGDSLMRDTFCNGAVCNTADDKDTCCEVGTGGCLRFQGGAVWPTARTMCYGVADPHMRTLAGAPFEFQWSTGDFIFYSGPELQVQARYEFGTGVTAYSGQTAFSMTGNLVCNRNIEVYMKKNPGSFPDPNNGAEYWIDGVQRTTAQFVTEMETCNSLCSITPSNIIDAQGTFTIVFNGSTEFKASRINGGNAYGMDMYLWVNPDQRGISFQSERGLCNHQGDWIQAQCDRTTQFGTTFQKAGWNTNCGNRRRMNADGEETGEWFSEWFPEEFQIGDRRRLAITLDELERLTRELVDRAFDECRANTPQLYNDAETYCRTNGCADQDDGLGDMGVTDCMYDICVAQDLTAGNMMVGTCNYARNKDTDPEKKAILVSWTFDNYDTNGNGFLDRTEMNQLFSDKGTPEMTQGDFLWWLSRVSPNDADLNNGYRKIDLIRMFEDPDFMDRVDIIRDYRVLVDSGKINPVPDEDLALAHFDTALTQRGFKPAFPGQSGVCAGNQPAGMAISYWAKDNSLNPFECMKEAKDLTNLHGWSYTTDPPLCYLHYSDLTNQNAMVADGWRGPFPRAAAPITGVNGGLKTQCFVQSAQAPCDTNAGCSDTEELQLMNFCAGAACTTNDRAQCCRARQSCQAGAAAIDCAPGLLLHQNRLCTGFQCDVSDRTYCCAPNGDCNDVEVTCDTNTQILKTNEKCAGIFCTQNDAPVCCGERADCDFNAAGCAQGQIVNTNNRCLGFTCSPAVDNAICCQDTCTPPANWCDAPMILKNVDCDNDNVADWACIDPLTMRRKVLNAKSPGCVTQDFVDVAQCPDAFTPEEIGDCRPIGAMTECYSVADPHNRDMNGVAFEFQQFTKQDYIFYKPAPGSTQRTMTIQGRFERYHNGGAGFTSVTGMVIQGPMTCGMKIEVFPFLNPGVWSSLAPGDNRVAHVLVTGPNPSNGAALNKNFNLDNGAHVNEFISLLDNCDSICSHSTAAQMMTNGGDITISFKGQARVRFLNMFGYYARHASTQYGMNVYMWIPPQLSGAPWGGYRGLCASNGDWLPAHCTDPWAKDLFSNQPAGYCSNAQGRRRLQEATIDLDWLEQVTQQAFQDSKDNCDAQLLNDATIHCEACIDNNDGKMESQVDQCIYDACENNTLQAALSMTDTCRSVRNAATEPDVRAQLVRHTFSQYDTNGNRFLNFNEFNNLLRESGALEFVDQAEFNELLLTVNANGNTNMGFTSEDIVDLYSLPMYMGRFNSLAEYEELVNQNIIPEIPEENLLQAFLPTALALNGYSLVGEGICANNGRPLRAWFKELTYTDVGCAREAFSRGEVAGFTWDDFHARCIIHVGDAIGYDAEFRAAGWTEQHNSLGTDDIDGTIQLLGSKCYSPTNQAQCNLACNANQVPNRAGLCATDTCDAGDNDACCSDRAPCDANVNCVQGTFLGGGLCAGAECNESDRGTCCAAAAFCNVNCAAHGMQTRLVAFCQTAFCDHTRDRDNCCWGAVPTPDPTADPTATPRPTSEPSREPTETPRPTADPTNEPTNRPSRAPRTPRPTNAVTPDPTRAVTPDPTPAPTHVCSTQSKKNKCKKFQSGLCKWKNGECIEKAAPASAVDCAAWNNKKSKCNKYSQNACQYNSDTRICDFVGNSNSPCDILHNKHTCRKHFPRCEYHQTNLSCGDFRDEVPNDWIKVEGKNIVGNRANLSDRLREASPWQCAEKCEATPDCVSFGYDLTSNNCQMKKYGKDCLPVANGRNAANRQITFEDDIVYDHYEMVTAC